MESILKIRDWIRTNGVMSEDGKSITYSCKELEGIISKTISQLPKQEISDEEIEKAIDELNNDGQSISWEYGFEEGAKWYREQLKQRQ